MAIYHGMGSIERSHKACTQHDLNPIRSAKLKIVESQASGTHCKAAVSGDEGTGIDFPLAPIRCCGAFGAGRRGAWSRVSS